MREIEPKEFAMLRTIMVGLTWVCLFATSVNAQSVYPSRPVRIVVPTAPGGAADIIARALAQHFSVAFGQQFFVDNRPGAGNIIGIEFVAHAPPDGHTLLISASTFAINHLLYKSLPYDAVRDFAPVTQLVLIPNVIVVHPAQPFMSLGDLIAAAKRQPGTLSYASAGHGSQLHLTMELLKSMAGIDLTHIPYKGAALALNDVLAGHVQMMVSNVLSAKPHADAGAIRPLAVTSLTRTPAMPNIPTVSEAGVKDFEVLNWFGMFAPAGTPQDIVDRLYAETARALTSPDLKARLAAEGAETVGSTPSAFTVFVAAEIKKWSEVARVSNIRPN